MNRWQWFRFWLSSPRRFRMFFIVKYYEITGWFWSRWLDRKARQNNKWIRERDPRANYVRNWEEPPGWRYIRSQR